jgi:hypothetical protein
VSSPYLVACLATLRGQFNHEFPTRDTGADGWIADSAHSSTSDHQPNAQGAVRAIDIDVDLHRPGITLWQVCEMLRGDARLEYIIHMGKIASRSHGWTWRTYTGSSDPHTNHAHFSARHDGTGWSSTAGWGLETLMTKDELRAVVDDALGDFFARGSQGAANDDTVTSRIGRDALDQGVPNPIRGRKTPAWQLLGDVATAVKPK